jgi:uncharacterized protein (DUF1015 family)
MVDFRPFRGLRYDASAVGDIGGCLAPPFDVIDAAEQAALHERNRYNIIRLELAHRRADEAPDGERYSRAAAALEDWQAAGVLVREEQPAFYVYVQEFSHDGRRYSRTAVLGRLRLEPWEANVVRPHEETMRAPKQDRLELLRHLRTNISPVFASLRARRPGADLAPPAGEALFDVETADGGRHRLSALRSPDGLERITHGTQDEPAYILDGHHRYETALAYRDECRAKAASWTGEEPENFVLAALTTADDAGLLLLPTHRRVRPTAPPQDLQQRLQRFFEIEDVTPKSYDGTALLRLLARLSAAGGAGTAFGALGLEEGRLHLLTLRDIAAVRSLMPPRSDVWQFLDASVFEYAVLRAALGIEPDTPGALEYTDDAQHALHEVEAARWPLAFLLNATRIDQMLAVADAGERMPAKSTYFYPKLATGLVLNPLD